MFTNNYEKNDIIMIAFGCIYVFDVFPTKTPKTWVHPKKNITFFFFFKNYLKKNTWAII